MLRFLWTKLSLLSYYFRYQGQFSNYVCYVKDDVEKCDLNNQHLDITYIGEEIKDS